MARAVRKTRTITTAWKAHRWLYRISGGRLATTYGGRPILQLTTVGRKSGEPRAVLLPYLRDGEAFLVIASNAGEPKDPAWALNLRAHPDATVRAGGRTLAVRSHEATGEERTRLWRLAVEAESSYQDYERRVDRDIPVVVLEPVG